MFVRQVDDGAGGISRVKRIVRTKIAGAVVEFIVERGRHGICKLGMGRIESSFQQIEIKTGNTNFVLLNFRVINDILHNIKQF